MNDPKKSAEALKKIQEIQNRMKVHTSRIAQIESEKNGRIKSYDQQIKVEQDQVNQLSRQINDLKRYI